MNKRLNSWLLLVTVLLLIPLWMAMQKRLNNTTYILSNYAKMDQNAIWVDHIGVQESQRYPNPMILRTTWFPLQSSQGICAPASQVRSDGSAEAWVDACGNTNRHLLPSLPNEKLFAALRELPPSQQPRSPQRSVILTFCTNDNCTSRVYDRASLPPQVPKIYKLIGAPLKILPPHESPAATH